MIYLADANIVSEPTKPAPEPRVLDWLGTHEEEIVVNSIVVGELWAGIIALPAGRKRGKLEQWFAGSVDAMECLPWDEHISRRWAELVVDMKRRGQKMPLLDSMIAATALHHNLVLVTRNTSDFLRAGVRVFDPFA